MNEHIITVRDGERHVVLFRFLDADSGTDAIHALSRGLARDPDFGTGNHAESEINWPDLVLRHGDLIAVSASSPYYEDELIRALAQDLSEQIVLAPGTSEDEYTELARKLYKIGWRRIPDEENENGE